MIYISQKDQQRIQNKISILPQKMKNPIFPTLFFQFFGTALFSYGICQSIYLHPIDQRIPNPAGSFLISCFFYFAISVAAPFSGGHINPAVTVAVGLVQRNQNKRWYFIGQIVGALFGAFIAYLAFGVTPMPYQNEDIFSDVIIDFISQVFGTFIFIFFILIVTQTNYISGQYFKYLVLAIMLFAGRMTTLRKGVLNPALGIAFCFFAFVQKGNFALFVPYCLPFILGPILGGALASLFFKNFYMPLKQMLYRKAQLEEGLLE